MKTTKKALLLALCAVLLVVSTVFATLAYLTSTTEVVENTFTIGKVKITLDEAKVTEYGVVEGTSRVIENTYKLMPGHEYTKDPTIHVVKGSEECYLFVKITDDIAAIQDNTTVATQMAANGWLALNGVENVYYLNKTIDARKADADIDVPVFKTFKIKGDADVASYDGKTITVQAYAIQKDGFNTAADAWKAAPSNWVAPSVSQPEVSE